MVSDNEIQVIEAYFQNRSFTAKELKSLLHCKNVSNLIDVLSIKSTLFTVDYGRYQFLDKRKIKKNVPPKMPETEGEQFLFDF